MMFIREVTPFLNSIYEVHDVGLNLQPLRDRVSEMEKDDTLWWYRNEGKQTHNLVDVTYPEYQELFDRINDGANRIASSWGIGRIKMSCYFTNIDRRFGFSESHSHINSVLSGVFYLTIPDNSGDIVFERPDAQEYQFKIATNNTQYTNRSYRVTPRENMALFFPSFMKHSVSVHKIQDHEKRISIAFDYTFL